MSRCRSEIALTGQMQVELLHGNDLAVAAAGCATLDAKGWALRRLADAGEGDLAEVGAKGLREADGGRRLALAEGRGRDAVYA
jgi:hypothetical protein